MNTVKLDSDTHDKPCEGSRKVHVLQEVPEGVVDAFLALGLVGSGKKEKQESPSKASAPVPAPTPAPTPGPDPVPQTRPQSQSLSQLQCIPTSIKFPTSPGVLSHGPIRALFLPLHKVLGMKGAVVGISTVGGSDPLAGRCASFWSSGILLNQAEHLHAQALDPAHTMIPAAASLGELDAVAPYEFVVGRRWRRYKHGSGYFDSCRSEEMNIPPRNPHTPVVMLSYELVAEVRLCLPYL